MHDCRVQTPAKCTNQEKTPATRRFGQGVSLWIIGELPKKKIAVSTSYLETGKFPSSANCVGGVLDTLRTSSESTGLGKEKLYALKSRPPESPVAETFRLEIRGLPLQKPVWFLTDQH